MTTINMLVENVESDNKQVEITLTHDKETKTYTIPVERRHLTNYFLTEMIQKGEQYEVTMGKHGPTGIKYEGRNHPI